MHKVLSGPGLPSFDYVRVSDLNEVLLLLKEHGEAARLLMGGTDLFVRMRDGLTRGVGINGGDFEPILGRRPTFHFIQHDVDLNFAFTLLCRALRALQVLLPPT